MFPVSTPRRLLSMYVLMQRRNITFYFPQGKKIGKLQKDLIAVPNITSFFFKFQAVSLKGRPLPRLRKHGDS